MGLIELTATQSGEPIVINPQQIVSYYGQRLTADRADGTRINLTAAAVGTMTYVTVQESPEQIAEILNLAGVRVHRARS